MPGAETDLNPAPITEGERLSLCSLVAFVSREAWIRADETGQPAEPFAAIVSGIGIDKERNLTGTATLHVLDPESPSGIRVERNVPPFDGSGPGYRVLPIRLDLGQFAALIDSRVQFVAEGGAGGVGEGAREELTRIIDERIALVQGGGPVGLAEEGEAQLVKLIDARIEAVLSAPAEIPKVPVSIDPGPLDDAKKGGKS